MKALQLLKSLWLSFIIGILTIPAVYAAPIIGSQKCQLGETCKIGPSTGHIYYPVTAYDGTIYSCTIKATDSNHITVKLFGFQDFTFQTKNVSADNNGTTITLSGRFTGNNGAIKIRQTTGLTTNGTVVCKAGT